MADQNQAPDSAQAPGGQQAGNQAGAASPDSSALQQQLQALQAERALLAKRAQDNQAAYTRAQQEIGRLRQIAAQYQGQDEEAPRQGMPDMDRERVGFLFAATMNPTLVQNANKVQEILSDPMRASAYQGYQDPAERYTAIAKDIELEMLRAKVNEQAQRQEKVQDATNSLKLMAASSGGAATELPEGLTYQQIQAMSADEMVKRGLVRLAPNNPYAPRR